MGKTSGLNVVTSLFGNRWILFAANDEGLELALLLALERAFFLLSPEVVIKISPTFEGKAAVEARGMPCSQ